MQTCASLLHFRKLFESSTLSAATPSPVAKIAVLAVSTKSLKESPEGPEGAVKCLNRTRGHPNLHSPSSCFIRLICTSEKLSEEPSWCRTLSRSEQTSKTYENGTFNPQNMSHTSARCLVRSHQLHMISSSVQLSLGEHRTKSLVALNEHIRSKLVIGIFSKASHGVGSVA